MRNLYFIFLVFIVQQVIAQDSSRGGNGTRVTTEKTGDVRALIIGVSDYNDKKLKLNYADNDAALFKLYLTDIDKVPEENIELFINNKATSLNIIRGFKRLVKSTQPGDEVYIYFAGHGDVVNDFGKKEGFLLASDSNSSQEYHAGGSIPLVMMNNIIEAIIAKEAKVNLVLDACHSGFVFQEGTQMNMGTIQAMFENSTKFISCGPEELSFESSDLQHGYFTYYLVDALSGKADSDSDGNLQYREVDNYLYDNVYSTVSKKHQQAQTPVIRTKNDREILKSIQSMESIALGQSLNDQVESTVKNNQRGIINIPKRFENKDALLVKKFNQAISKKAYTGNSNSALSLYKQALANGNLSESYLYQMQGILLQELSYDAQLLINQYINGEKFTGRNGSFFKQAKNLEACLEILNDDDDDLIKNRLTVSKLLLESYGIIKNKNSARYKTAKRNLTQALSIEPRAAYIHNALGIVYNQEKVYDSAYFHFNKAKDLINSWSEPVLNIGDNYLAQYKYEKAKDFYSKSLGIEGQAVESNIKLGILNENLGKYSEAETYYTKALNLDPNNITASLKMSELEKSRGNFLASQEWYSKSVKNDSIAAISEYGLLNYVLQNKINDKTAEQLFLNAIENSPEESAIYTQYADYLRLTKRQLKRLKLADSLYSTAILKNPLDVDAYFGKARLQYRFRKKDKAQKLIETCLSTNTENAKALYLYANFLNLDSKEYQKAEEFYLKSLTINKLYTTAYTELVEMYNEQGQMEKSLSLLNNYTEKYPEVVNLWKLLGQTYQLKGDFQQAINAYKQSIIVDKNNIGAYDKLVYTQIEVNDLAAAKKHYMVRQDLGPDVNKMNEFTAHILYKAKNSKRFGTPSQTLDLYQLAFEINPTMETGLAYTEYLYLSSEAKQAIKVGESLYDKIETKADKINIVKLLIKACIDANDINKGDEYFNGLLKLQPNQPDHLLIGSYAAFKRNESLYQSSINKVNPGILRSLQLRESYSKETIQNYILRQ